MKRKYDKGSNKYYQTKRWKEVRVLVLNRDGGLCVRCNGQGRTTLATSVHHLRKISEAPALAFDPANLVAVCEGCHALLDTVEYDGGRVTREALLSRTDPLAWLND